MDDYLGLFVLAYGLQCAGVRDVGGCGACVGYIAPTAADRFASLNQQSLYVCDDFEIAVQTFAGGDLDHTLRQISGFSAAQLTMMETSCGDHTRYDMVWVAAGENGDLLCRGAVIDDGLCHYTAVAMVDAALAPEVKADWNALFASFCLADD